MVYYFNGKELVEAVCGCSSSYLAARIKLEDGSTISIAVHILMGLAFLGGYPTTKHVVNHINGIKSDNRLENLEMITLAENNTHARLTGLVPNIKLGIDDIDIIKLFKKDKATVLVEVFDVSVSTIYRIRNRSIIKVKDSWREFCL